MHKVLTLSQLTVPSSVSRYWSPGIVTLFSRVRGAEADKMMRACCSPQTLHQHAAEVEKEDRRVRSEGISAAIFYSLLRDEG